VHQAIADLASALPLPADQSGFDWWAYGTEHDLSRYAKLARQVPPPGLGDGSISGRFSGHRRTKHSAEVIRRFGTVPAGGKDMVGKHERLHWEGLCGALRAGTGSDRGSYQSVRPLHPVEDRVITVREGARLQGFPDWFIFHPTAWHSFRMIGNSVCPAVGQGVLSWIVDADRRSRASAAA
jgi:DNA (cytosine-5)-methyltransferase 1